MKVNLLDDRTDWWLGLDDEAIALGLVDSDSDVNNPMEGFLSRVIGVWIERIMNWQDTGKWPLPGVLLLWQLFPSNNCQLLVRVDYVIKA